MWARLAVWAVRFVVFAIIYVAIAAIWVDKATGWKGLEQFAMSIGYAIVATAAWLAAVAIGHRFIASQPLRLVIHPACAALLFLGAGLMISNSMPTEEGWGRVLPDFVHLVAGAAAADAVVGFLLERCFLSRA